MKIIPAEFDFDQLLQCITDRIDFSWARYGDGEINCLLQTRPGSGNCDGHEYFPDLGEKLRDILYSKPKYLLGLQRLGREQNQGIPQFDKLVELNKDQWCNNEILHHASIKGRLNEFIDLLQKFYHRVILVGNKHLRNVPFSSRHFVEIPEKNCWREFPRIYSQLLSKVNDLVPAHPIILYCASMMSNVMIDRIYNIENMADEVTQIDCGSVFDPYVGRNSRSYHHKLKIKR